MHVCSIETMVSMRWSAFTLHLLHRTARQRRAGAFTIALRPRSFQPIEHPRNERVKIADIRAIGERAHLCSIPGADCGNANGGSAVSLKSLRRPKQQCTSRHTKMLNDVNRAAVAAMPA